MRVFKNKSFARFARRAGLSDDQLCEAASEMLAGDFEADLGGHVYKKRIARAGGGKSGGFRTLVVLKLEMLVFFVYGFAKSDRSNISPEELRELKKLAKALIALSTITLQAEVDASLLLEVLCDAETVS